jgi:membrane associated rhomboid family serine protease
MKLFNDEDKKQIVRAFYLPIVLIYVIWVIKLIEVLGGVSFSNFGIYPRRIEGLIGILFSPLLHADFNHLINNSAPLLILTTSTIYFYRSIALRVLVMIWLITGFCVWVGGRPAYHIGASSVIYGEAAFLFFSGVIRRNITLLAISLLTVFLYGSMIWGIFPFDVKISWESHLFGGLTGMTLSFIYAKQGPVTEEKVWDDEPEETDPYWEVNEDESAGNKSFPPE